MPCRHSPRVSGPFRFTQCITTTTMNKFWSRVLKPRGKSVKLLLFITLVAIVLLNSSDQLEPVRSALDNERFVFTIADYQFSAYRILNILLTIALLIWIAAYLAELVERQMSHLTRMRAANRELVLKFLQISIYVVAALIALDLMGLDLTSLALFGGALGIGVGFGLQKIASNFISGLILLLEKSIEVGDLVELADGTYGFIRRTGARYTLIETFENKEILVPNEDFITSRVTNWTFSNHKARVEIPIGVSHDSDIEKVRDILLETASAHPRCAQDPAPACFLRGFGDSSVNFMLHFWVDDVENGRWTPQSEILFALWHRFAEEGIKIPYPQRDLHIKSAQGLAALEKSGSQGPAS